MLRFAFVGLIMLLGLPFAARDAIGALSLYLWYAYFRPDLWVWDTPLLQSLNLSLMTGVYLVIRAVFSSDTRFRVDLRASLLAALVAISLASTLGSVQGDYSWPFWTDFAKTLVVVYLMSVLIQTPAQYRLILLVIAFSLGFEGVKQGWLNLILHPGGRNDNRWPTLGDNNGVAVGMWMLASVFMALAATARTQWEKRLHQFCLVGIGYRALITYSRGGFLTAGTFVFTCVGRSRHKVRSLVAVLLVAGALLPVLPQEFWDRMSTIPTSEDAVAALASDDSEQNEDASMAGRLHFWRVGAQMGLDNAIFGVGLNAFSRFYDAYDTSGGEYGRRRAVHSTWFGTLAELGVGGFFIFMTLVVMTLVDSGRVAAAAKRGELPMEYHAFGIALQTGFGAALVGATFLSFQYNEMLWHFMGLSMALRAMAIRHVQAAAPAVANRNAPRVTVRQPAAAIPQT